MTTCRDLHLSDPPKFVLNYPLRLYNNTVLFHLVPEGYNAVCTTRILVVHNPGEIQSLARSKKKHLQKGASSWGTIDGLARLRRSDDSIRHMGSCWIRCTDETKEEWKLVRNGKAVTLLSKNECTARRRPGLCCCLGRGLLRRPCVSVALSC